MLWHFLKKATHGTWSTFIAVLFDTLLELTYRRRGSTFNIFISRPNTVSIMFISGDYEGHCMWWKGWFDIHATLFYQYHGWYSSSRIPNVNNRHDHVTFAEKCPILWLATYLLASNRNKHDDIGVLHQCMSKWVNEAQQNTDKCHF